MVKLLRRTMVLLLHLLLRSPLRSGSRSGSRARPITWEWMLLQTLRGNLIRSWSDELMKMCPELILYQLPIEYSSTVPLTKVWNFYGISSFFFSGSFMRTMSWCFKNRFSPLIFFYLFRSNYAAPPDKLLLTNLTIRTDTHTPHTSPLVFHTCPRLKPPVNPGTTLTGGFSLEQA